MKYISGNMFYFFKGVCYGEYIFINFLRGFDRSFIFTSLDNLRFIVGRKRKEGKAVLFRFLRSVFQSRLTLDSNRKASPKSYETFRERDYFIYMFHCVT